MPEDGLEHLFELPEDARKKRNVLTETAKHAVYVRENARKPELVAELMPEMIKKRLLSVPSFDNADCIVDADVVEGDGLPKTMADMFENETIENVHVHFAKHGCFTVRADRVCV